MADDVEPALGRQLLAAFRDEARVVGPHAKRKLDHRLGDRHLEIHVDAQAAAQLLDVAFLDVAAVLAQVDGDALGAGRLGGERYLHRIRVVDPARLPERGDVVDVHAEPHRRRHRL